MLKKQDNIVNSLAHTKWNCKYHIVFAPKYRRKIFYEEKRLAIRDILRTICGWKGVEIIEGEGCQKYCFCAQCLQNYLPHLTNSAAFYILTVKLRRRVVICKLSEP